MGDIESTRRLSVTTKTDNESLKKAINEVTRALQNQSLEFTDNLQQISAMLRQHSDLLQVLGDKVGTGGFPSKEELIAMLYQSNGNIESEYTAIIKNELTQLDERIKTELARLDLRINATETSNRLVERKLESHKPVDPVSKPVNLTEVN